MKYTLKHFIPPIVYDNLWGTGISAKQEGNKFWYKFWSSRKDVWKSLDLIQAYMDIPELSAIINMKANTTSNAIYKSVDKDGNEIFTTESDILLALLNKPNWLGGKNEFIVQTKVFRELFGNEFLYIQKPFAIDKPNQLFSIPQNLIKAEYRSDVPYFEQTDNSNVRYSYKTKSGQYKVLESSQVIHMNDNRVTMKSAVDKDLVLGESKVETNKVIINNMRAAYESRGVIIRKRGALGIISSDARDVGGVVPIEPEQKELLQKEYSENYGGMEHQDQLIITEAAIKYQQMGVNPDKLGLFQENEEGFNKLLDDFGVPSEIFSRTKGATYENQRQAEKGLYIRTIIPEANSWCSNLNMRFLNGSKARLIATYSHLPVFQEDLKSRAESLDVLVGALSTALADGAIDIETYQKELDKYGIKKLK
jgi:HK97 family phage portal protein